MRDYKQVVETLRKMLEIQGTDGTWNYDPYLFGMYNGIAISLAVVTGEVPQVRNAPHTFLSTDVVNVRELLDRITNTLGDRAGTCHPKSKPFSTVDFGTPTPPKAPAVKKVKTVHVPPCEIKQNYMCASNCKKCIEASPYRRTTDGRFAKKVK